jgi:hypothetical protein
MQAEEILQYARAISNDAIGGIAGDILADSQPYIFPILEGCYEDLQDRLINGGVNTFYTYAVITGLTAVATTDPTTQVQLTYTGYFDGVTMHATPTLPSNMLMPLEIWERQTGSTAAWSPVQQVSDSISTRPQTSIFGLFDWQTDELWFPGATLSRDIKLKYILYAPELTGASSPVLVARCKEALACLLVAEMADARGGTDADRFEARAEVAIKRIIERTSQKEAYAYYARRPFRSHRRLR